MPELVGQDLREITDVRGRHVILDLIDTAKSGGGFQRYAWPKPSMHGAAEKLASARKCLAFTRASRQLTAGDP